MLSLWSERMAAEKNVGWVGLRMAEWAVCTEAIIFSVMEVLDCSWVSLSEIGPSLGYDEARERVAREKGRIKLWLSLSSRWVRVRPRERGPCGWEREVWRAMEELGLAEVGEGAVSGWAENGEAKRVEMGISGSSRKPETHIRAKASRLDRKLMTRIAKILELDLRKYNK
jgi:hypothetical protein